MDRSRGRAQGGLCKSGPPADYVLLADFLALRTIVVNLQFALTAGETPTEEAVRRLINRADADRFQRAIERLVAMLQRRER